jgi:hypothetical protein
VAIVQRSGKAKRFLAVAALALAAPILLGSTGLGTNFDARLLAAHNRERSDSGIRPLVWDSGLAAEAGVWGDYLADIGDLEHSTDESDDPEGENLWLGTKRHFAPEEMVGMWIEEKQHFEPGIFPANSRTGDLDDVGHYTQLMWRATGRVGCALSRGDEYDVLVCRYREAGNVIGETPF